MKTPHRVVIVGAGFAGLSAAKGLAGADCEVTLVDRRNHHLFQPLLYQVATAGAVARRHRRADPLRSCAGRRTPRSLLAEVAGIDLAAARGASPRTARSPTTT